MNIYIIEKGSMAQHGEIFRTYQKLPDALLDMQVLADNYRGQDYKVTPGIDDLANNRGHVLCGFWAGYKDGNETAIGFRLLEFPIL